MLIKETIIKLVFTIVLCIITVLLQVVQAHQLYNKNMMDSMNQKLFPMDINKLNQIALNKHLGSQLREGSGFKQVYGRSIYRVVLLDNQKIRWAVDLDPETGEIISNMID